MIILKLRWRGVFYIEKTEETIYLLDTVYNYMLKN